MDYKQYKQYFPNPKLSAVQPLIVLVEQWHDFFTVLFQVCAALQKAHAELGSLHQPLKGYGLNLGCFNSGCRIQAGSVGRVLRTRVTEKQKMRDIKTHCLFSEHLQIREELPAKSQPPVCLWPVQCVQQMSRCTLSPTFSKSMGHICLAESFRDAEANLFFNSSSRAFSGDTERVKAEGKTQWGGS